MGDDHCLDGDFAADNFGFDRLRPTGRGAANRLRESFARRQHLAPDLAERDLEMAENDDVDGVFQTVTRFFEEAGWHFTKDENKRLLRMGARGRNGSYSCFAAVREDQVVLFVCVTPVNVPPDKRLAAAEFLTRANYGLPIGNFEMDFSDGEIRYKTSVDVERGKLTTPMVKSLVIAAIATTDRYFPGLMSLLWTDTSAELAVAKVEKKRGS